MKQNRIIPEIQDIRRRRRALGLNQHELAELSGVSVSTIGKLEAGITRDPVVSTLRNLERTLDRLESLAGRDRNESVA